MEAKEQAELMIAEFSLTVLSKIGHKLDMSDVTEIAKASALLAVHRVLQATSKIYGELNFEDVFELNEIKIDPYWKEVKQHIKAYGKDQ